MSTPTEPISTVADVDGWSDPQDQFESGERKHLEYDEPVLSYHTIVAETAAKLAPQNGVVADFGCGPGQILSRLAELRPDLKLVGIDGDDECLRRAGLRCSTAEFINGNIESPTLPEGQSRFDVVLSSHSLEHLTTPVDSLRRWSQFLSDDGRLVVAVPNSLQPILLGRALVRRPKINDGHYYIWDWATFANFCTLAGFNVESVTRDYVPLAPVRVRRRIPVIGKVEKALLNVIPQFSNSHIVVLEPKFNEE